MKSKHGDMIKTITSDQYAGQGGSYLLDPATGQRTPAPDESSDPPEKVYTDLAAKD
jgi:hypothetical protein